ncbi:MAG: hypothetical protein PHW53_01410 [Patescibacteria group bacterium]|nr:hypothetical protein [Patescibacteria group bacterium]
MDPNNDAWKYGLFFWGGLFVLIAASTFIRSPGPDNGARACVANQDTLVFTMQMDVSDAIIYTPRAIRVGSKGNMFERLTSIKAGPNGTWLATFHNTLTGRTGTKILPACPKDNK